MEEALEVVRPGWARPGEHADHLVLDPAVGLTARIGSRAGVVRREDVDRVEVWRAADGERRYRVLGPDDRTLAVLSDARWAVPGGRLTPHLERLGWGLVTRDADDVRLPQEVEKVVGRRTWPALLGPVGGTLVLLALLVGIGATVSGADLPDAPLVLGVVAAWAGLLGAGALLLALVARARSVPSAPGSTVRPGAGTRPAWRRDAGLARIDGRVVLWDGWGRTRPLPAVGAGAPAAVALTDAAVVLLDAQARPVVRLPASDWGPPAEVAEAVTVSTGIGPADAAPPRGGEVVDDPAPPSPALLLVGCGLLVLALLPALAVGLFEDRRWAPRAMVWVPAALVVGGGLVTAVGSGLADRRRRRGAVARGGALPGVPEGPAALVWMPTAAGLALLVSPITYVAALPEGALAWWLGVLTLASLGCAAAAVVVAGTGPHAVSTAVVPVATLLVLLAVRDAVGGRLALAVLVLAAGSAVVCLSGVVGAWRGSRPGA